MNYPLDNDSDAPDDDSRIQLNNGWSAEDLGNRMYYIYDESGNPLSYVKLGDDDDFYTYDFEANIVPLGNVTITTEPPETTENQTKPDKDDDDDPVLKNPKTGDYIIIAVLALILSGTVLYLFRHKSNHKN